MRREQKERWGPCGYCFIIKIILIQIRGGEIFSLFPTNTLFLFLNVFRTKTPKFLKFKLPFYMELLLWLKSTILFSTTPK